ncbi:RNA polymerase recycling motor ATPase HelR [Pimelobacter sp. 30-1]|uniref:RNA polymerase recycling motor ATPase HelR n=1 Tax=Pimelobacter sp. 30-1 TaxID=2004991 RepID=UPI001C04168C|nr:RNA polymerase recycling motor ATPase HelR [Pimelobacter sp. 30-1]MBU2698401.1 AAA family ATPase [Pimelobacter sp. 30-1]
MTPRTASPFALPDRLSAKTDPSLITHDEAHLGAIAASIEHTVADLTARLDEARRAPGGSGTEALERDQEVHRLSNRLRALRRFGWDLCLGRMVAADSPEPVYVGRLGLTDPDGRRLLVDWRSPAAEAFFAATHAHPLGLVSRRRYRWTGGRITDYWDEVFTAEGLDDPGNRAALDDQSAFIASLGSARSERMRDVLGTIQSDQDAIIRAGSRGTLVVDGGPGTGKTVVALHRSAYLLYADPRLGREGHHRGGILFVGPHRPYLAYVADVLPSLGEEGVQTCTLADLVPEGAAAVPEADTEVARLKSSAALVGAIDKAVAIYEEPPAQGMPVDTPWADFWVSTADWAEAFGAPEPGVPHNEARDQVWDALLDILVDKLDAESTDVPEDALRAALRRHPELVDTLHGAWPLLTHTDVVADLWAVPAYLRACAPWLSPEEQRALRRPEGSPWTTADLPLLDAARLRLGDRTASARRQRQAAQRAADREEMSAVVDHLIASDDSDLMIMSMLRGEDLRGALDDPAAVPDADPDLLAGPFAHVVVDEAQELTDAEWQMLLLRCPSRSFTVVGDRAQARHGFTDSWTSRLTAAGLDRISLASLSVNYRTPEEVMAEAEPVIRAALPDANVPTSIRRSGVPVRHGSPADLDTVVDTWLAEHPDGEGVACVIGAPSYVVRSGRVRSLPPELVKGLEFDLVVLVEPGAFGDGIEGAVDRYVAMTRATGELVILAG